MPKIKQTKSNIYIYIYMIILGVFFRFLSESCEIGPFKTIVRKWGYYNPSYQLSRPFVRACNQQGTHLISGRTQKNPVIRLEKSIKKDIFEENDLLGSFCLFSRWISLVFLLRGCFRMFQVYFFWGPNTSKTKIWKPRVCFLRRRYLRMLNLARKCMGLLVLRFKQVMEYVQDPEALFKGTEGCLRKVCQYGNHFPFLTSKYIEPQRSYPPSCLRKEFPFPDFCDQI